MLKPATIAWLVIPRGGNPCHEKLNAKYSCDLTMRRHEFLLSRE